MPLDSSPSLRAVHRARRLVALYSASLGVFSVLSLGLRQPYLEKKLHLGWTSLLEAVLLALCAFLVGPGAGTPLWVAMGIVGLPALTTAAHAVSAGETGALWTIPARMLLLLP